MSEKIRCVACRGSKQVAKLGGIMGECNTCEGKGTILAADKPKMAEPEVVESVTAIVAAVSECVPVKAPEIVAPTTETRKRLLIKRKKSA